MGLKCERLDFLLQDGSNHGLHLGMKTYSMFVTRKCTV
jgi:hypothetical protein